MTIDELRELAENERTRQKQYISRILYCSSAGCLSGGSDSVKADSVKHANSSAPDVSDFAAKVHLCSFKAPI
jgi:hypothetical protein